MPIRPQIERPRGDQAAESRTGKLKRMGSAAGIVYVAWEMKGDLLSRSEARFGDLERVVVTARQRVAKYARLLGTDEICCDVITLRVKSRLLPARQRQPEQAKHGGNGAADKNRAGTNETTAALATP